jgi:hypothetical protein
LKLNISGTFRDIAMNIWGVGRCSPELTGKSKKRKNFTFEELNHSYRRSLLVTFINFLEKENVPSA